MGRLFYKPENAWVGDFIFMIQEYVIKNMPKILHGI